MKNFKASAWAILLTISTAVLLALLSFAFGLPKVIDVLTSQIAAAWVQAIGSIAAVAIAIWITNGTKRSERENARTTAKHFVRLTQAAIGGLWVASKISSEEADVQKARFLGELKEVHFIGQSIPIGQLSAELCDCVLETRTLVARCYELGVDIRSRRPSPPTTPNCPPLRDGFSIGLALLEASWRDSKTLTEKVNSL